MVVFIFFDCLHLCRTKNKLKSHEKVCENGIPSKEDKVLEFNQYQKSDKALAIIYVDFQSSIKKYGYVEII